jgi:3-hydroxy-9,10-secoandrosta-1,3,5(10)-triene-9,17-dione monooxygenase
MSPGDGSQPKASLVHRKKVSMTTTTQKTIAQPEPDLTAIDLIGRATALRERLLSEQDATDDRGSYSSETHEAFRKAGFYRTLLPRRFGGYEFDVPTFLRMIIEISRGCPGTGWNLCLAAGHGLQIGGLFGEEAQLAALSPNGEFAAPMRALPMGTATRESDGWRIDGTWDYCSGSPHSTHAILAVRLVDDGKPAGLGLALVPRSGWTLRDDWRERSFGMRGSGSNSISIEGVVIPDYFVVVGNLLAYDSGLDVPGYRLHGNPMYAGNPIGYLQLEITSVLVGCAYAALDEYERILRAKKTPGPKGVARVHVPTFQRYWGLAAGKINAAEDVLLRCSERFMQLCHDAVDGGYQAEDLMRLNASTHHAVNLLWEAVELLFRTSGTSEGGTNGSRMQRYYRDFSTARTNIGLQFETYAEIYGQQHLGVEVTPLV